MAHEIKNSAGGANDDGGIDPCVALDNSRDGGDDPQILDKPANSADDLFNLAGQFTTGGQDQRLRGLGPGKVDARQHGGNESCRLAGTRLRLGHHVLRRVAKHEGKRFSLNLGRLEELEGEKAFLDLVRPG